MKYQYDKFFYLSFSYGFPIIDAVIKNNKTGKCVMCIRYNVKDQDSKVYGENYIELNIINDEEPENTVKRFISAINMDEALK